ncbi:MAG: VacJ family lipoprotein [Smithellaceae bacterium]|nr:VacJ family lipoprotein [Smithellaceae bacterium]
MISAGVTPIHSQAAGTQQALEKYSSVQQAAPANAGSLPVQSSEKTGVTENDPYADEQNLDYDDDPFAEARVTIADPIEPLNRISYLVNDRLYYWAIKPAASVYKWIIPEPARISVKRFYLNAKFPIRFINCLLQADLSGAGIEFGRFTINTIWGIGGLLDPAAGGEIKLAEQDTDFGQTLGMYGVGHGFYIMWPVLGPSSPRDSVDIAGEYFLDPLSYIGPWYTGIGIRPFKIINNASLVIGEYESLQAAALDPYVAIRDAYAQYRAKAIKARKARSLIFKDDGAGDSPDSPSTVKE